MSMAIKYPEWAKCQRERALYFFALAETAAAAGDKNKEAEERCNGRLCLRIAEQCEQYAKGSK